MFIVLIVLIDIIVTIVKIVITTVIINIRLHFLYLYFVSFFFASERLLYIYLSLLFFLNTIFVVSSFFSPHFLSDRSEQKQNRVSEKGMWVSYRRKEL